MESNDKKYIKRANQKDTMMYLSQSFSPWDWKCNFFTLKEVEMPYFEINVCMKK